MVDVTWLRLQVPDWVHRRIKAKAAMKGVTLHDYLNKVLEREAEAEDDEESK